MRLAYARYVTAIGREPAPMVADYAVHVAAGHAHLAVDEHDGLLGVVVFFPKDGWMHLDAVAVLPTASGRGIGKALIRLCEDEARRLSLTGINLYTNEKMTENLMIYPHLGYVEVARRTDEGFSRVFFEKRFD